MSTGREIKAAFKKAATWGTAVACAQADAILITSESITRKREQLLDDSAGQAYIAAADQGLITCGGELQAYLRYQGLEALLAMVMGQAEPPSPTDGDLHNHNLSPAANVDGLFGTLAMHKGVSVHEFPAVKVEGFTISGKAGQPLSISFNVLCDDRRINTTDGVNNNAAFSAIGAPPAAGRVLFRQGRFLLNDRDAEALGPADEIRPSGFSLSFKRNLAGDHLAGGGDAIAEPIATGFPELSLELEFPVYTSDVFLRDLGADTRKKMTISFSGAGGQAMTFTMPHVALTNAEASINGAGKITHPIAATLLAPASAPAGMSGLGGPLHIAITNDRASGALA